MSNDKYLGVRPGDLDSKLYAKYWDSEMGGMQSHVHAALMHGIEASALGLSIYDVNQLLEPGYLPLENGYTRLDDGQVFAAVLTKMPGVNGRMIDWWFGWHYLESQRYKLWHPRCHVANRAEKMISDDPGLSDREKYLNNPNFVTEYVGSKQQEIIITFNDPSVYFDTSRFSEANVSTVLCGTVGFQKLPLNFGVLIHMIRETEEGCEMRSRFWLGKAVLRGAAANGVLNRIAGSRLIAKLALPDSMGRDMVVHCAMEMNHLAGFLPDLYRDYVKDGSVNQEAA